MPVVYVIIGLLVGALVAFVITRQRQRAVVSDVAPAAAPLTGVDEKPLPKENLAPVDLVLDALPIGVVYADATGTVVVRNRMALHAAGARHGDIIVDEAVEGLLRSALLGRERRQTLDLFGPPPRVLLVHAQPVESGGAIATISDITERARLDAVRTDFVANISHELKTPVGALSLLAEALADADEPDVIARLSSKIVREADRLTVTIEDLLELSLIELGGDQVRERLAVGRILAEVADRVQGLAESRGSSVIVQQLDQPMQVLGDRRQLVSALGNLVDNALKYSEPGSNVNLGAHPSGGNVCFTVTDHGIGIASQHLDRIFERFYRVDRARSRDTGGVGLGLAIVRHVAANHGGEVNVSSQEGEGSTFTLTIPAGPDLVNPASTTDSSLDEG